MFNEVNQLTSSTSQVSGQGSAGKSSSTYSYDGNGNRTSQTESGAKTDYGFNAQNQVTSVTTTERSSSFAYDGLGRQLEAEDTTSLGSTGTTSVWSGSQVVQQSNTVSGITTLVRDAQGDLAVQGRDDASKWALLDGLSSTAAQAVGGSVTQLSNYSDWGVQGFESSGWDAAVNFTGETTDAGYGLNSYLSRTYDPTTGTWLSQDSWRGLLTEPQTVARYAYVLNNPISMVDSLGYEPHPGMEGGYNSATAIQKRQIAMLPGTADAAERWIESGAAQAPMAPAPSVNFSEHPVTATSPQSNSGTQVSARHCSGVGRFRICSNNPPNPIIVNSWDEFWDSELGLVVDLATMAIPGSAVLAIAKIANRISKLNKIIKTEKAAEKSGSVAHGVAEAAKIDMKLALSSQKMTHVFVPKHKLGPLVKKFGSEEAVMSRVLNSITTKVPVSGKFEVSTLVGGQRVVVRGNVIDGVIKLGTMFTP